MSDTVIYIFYLALMLGKVSSYDIIVSDSEEYMSNAFRKCNEIGGTLLTNDEVHAYADQITAQCPEVKDIFWIGNYSTMTPVLSFEGCYEYNRFSETAYFEISDNSVAKCQARCNTERGIAIKGNICQCLAMNNLSTFTRVEAQDCGIRENEEVRGGSNGPCLMGYQYESNIWPGNICQCLAMNNLSTFTRVEAQDCGIRENEEVRGGSDEMSVYLRKGDGDGVTPYCVYGRCEGRRKTLTSDCELMGEAKTICSVEGMLVSYGETSDWWNAMQTCFSNNSYLISNEEFDRNSLCEPDDKLVWMNRRQYMDTITLPANGLRVNYIHNENIVCHRINMTEFTTVQTRQCNGPQSYRYLCKIDVHSNESASCVVNLSTDSPKTSTISTSEVLTSSISISNSSQSPIVTNGPVLITAERMDPETSDDSEQVIIIVGSAAGGVVVLLLVGFILFVVKRKSEKSSNNSDKFSNLNNTEENTQSITGVHNRVFEKTEPYAVVDKGEFHCDPAKGMDIQSSTAHNVCRQNQNAGGDSTYDHVTNSGDPNIYNRSRSDVKSIRGDNVYDKMDTNIYDKTNTERRDKMGDNIYDKTNENVYDGTETGRRNEVGDNIYDKTNENVYDETKTDRRDEIGDNIYDKTNENVYDGTNTSVGETIGDFIYDKTNDNVYERTNTSGSDQVVDNIYY